MCNISIKKRPAGTNLDEEKSAVKHSKEILNPIKDVLADVVSDLFSEAKRDSPNKPLANAPTRESRAVEEENIGVIQFRIVFNNPDSKIDQDDVKRLVAVSTLYSTHLTMSQRCKNEN